MILKFTDGVEFDTSGDYRLEHRADGWYVVGNGVLCSVTNESEGLEMIDRLQRKDR